METNTASIFISHISDEGELAVLLKQNLMTHFGERIKVFVSSDLESIVVGEEWLGSIKSALDLASLELILCSRLSITRPWVNFELGAAWLKKIPIVPVCHSGLQVTDLPVPYSLLNGVEAGQERDLRKLHKSVAKCAGVDAPDVDLNGLADAVAQFERSYAADVRMRGHAGALMDLKQGERLLGSWEGTGSDLEIPDYLAYKTKLSYELKLDLRRRQNTISGELHIQSTQSGVKPLAFIEMVNVSDGYFYFKYWLAIPNANHCGFMLMKLSILGDRLEGMFLTNKVLEPQIGLGRVDFQRVES